MTDDPTFGGSGEDALLDATLRDLLTHIPDSAEAADLPAAALSAIDRAVHEGWPGGIPPTAEEIAREDAGADDPAAHTDDGFEHQAWHTDLHGHDDPDGHDLHHDHNHGDHDPHGHSDGGHHYDGGHH